MKKLLIALIATTGLISAANATEITFVNNTNYTVTNNYSPFESSYKKLTVNPGQTVTIDATSEYGYNRDFMQLFALKDPTFYTLYNIDNIPNSFSVLDSNEEGINDHVTFALSQIPASSGTLFGPANITVVCNGGHTSSIVSQGGKTDSDSIGYIRKRCSKSSPIQVTMNPTDAQINGTAVKPW